MAGKMNGKLGSLQRILFVVLVAVGGAALGWFLQIAGRDHHSSIGETFAASLLAEHNRGSPQAVRDLSEMTRDEMAAACASLQSRLSAEASAKQHSLQTLGATSLAAIACWVIAAVLTISRRVVRRSHRLAAAVPTLADSDDTTMLGPAV